MSSSVALCRSPFFNHEHFLTILTRFISDFFPLGTTRFFENWQLIPRTVWGEILGHLKNEYTAAYSLSLVSRDLQTTITSCYFNHMKFNRLRYDTANSQAVLPFASLHCVSLNNVRLPPTLDLTGIKSLRKVILSKVRKISATSLQLPKTVKEVKVVGCPVIRGLGWIPPDTEKLVIQKCHIEVRYVMNPPKADRKPLENNCPKLEDQDCIASLTMLRELKLEDYNVISDVVSQFVALPSLKDFRRLGGQWNDLVIDALNKNESIEKLAMGNMRGSVLSRMKFTPRSSATTLKEASFEKCQYLNEFHLEGWLKRNQHLLDDCEVSVSSTPVLDSSLISEDLCGGLKALRLSYSNSKHEDFGSFGLELGL